MQDSRNTIYLDITEGSHSLLINSLLKIYNKNINYLNFYFLYLHIIEKYLLLNNKFII